ncbi:MAG: hypothetical protein NC095_07290 [Muribaculum sp.]|nr:hypothetical protein [Muribaculum sp.]
MKKFLLTAILAAMTASMNAESFADYFKLTFGDKVIENGQTVTEDTYYDEYADLGFDDLKSYMAAATVKATNVNDESLNLDFNMTCVNEKTAMFQLCYDFESAPGNCLGAQNGQVTSPANLRSIEAGSFIKLDIHEVDIQDFTTPTTFKLDLSARVGDMKLEGSDCTIYVNFTHTKDITAAVDGIEVDAASAEYFNLQGVKVAQPEKGSIYIVRKGSKVTKQLF